MKAKLVRTLVDRLEPRETAYDVYDTALQGFAARVNPGGSKSFIVRYRPKGGGRAVNPRTHTLGKHPQLTPEQARDMAREVLAAVAAGKDPADQKETPQTVGAVLDAYLAYLAGRSSLRIVKGDVENHLRPAFGHLLPREVTPTRVRRFYNPLEEAGHERRASACLSALRTAFKRAGLEPPSLGTVTLTTWRQRERAASREELGRVLTACRDMLAEGDGWPWAIYLIVLLILTGARPAEIRKALRTEVDLEKGLLIREQHKTRRKTKKPRVIELNMAACEIIARMPEVQGNPHLIPGRRHGTFLAEYGTAWRRICSKERANIEKLWVYDLRRTFASLGLGRGATLDQIGKLLGHTHASTTAGYAWLLPTDRQRVAAEVGKEIAGLLPDFLASGQSLPADTALAPPV